MNEMNLVDQFRAEVGLPDPERSQRQEARFSAAIADQATARRLGRRRLALRSGLLAAGLAAAVTAGISVIPAEPDDTVVSVHPMPVAASEVLTRAADNVGGMPELHPKPGQFLVFHSQTMYPTETDGARYLARGKRQVWMPVEGDSTRGFIRGETLKPEPYGDWPIPPVAYEGVGDPGSVEKLADFDQRAEYLRTDYAYVSRLPTDPEGMYEHLYTRLGRDLMADREAWGRVGGLLSESYLPKAQRAALFRAAAAIPGVVTVEKAVDAAGRTGIAAAWVDPELGERNEYIFDPETYRYLGQSTVVTDATRAKAPVGTVLTSVAQLKVRLVDEPPTAQSD